MWPPIPPKEPWTRLASWRCPCCGGSALSEFIRLRDLSSHEGRSCFINMTYAVAISPSAERYFIFFLCFVFALYERKNETQIQWEVQYCRRRSKILAIGTAHMLPYSIALQGGLLCYAGQPTMT